MAIRLSDGSTFLHNPRCGGTFVTAVLRKCGVVEGPVGRKHDCPGVVPMTMTEPLRVFVRHPYDYIRSLFAFQSAHDWPEWPKNSPDDRWWHPWSELNDPPPAVRDNFDAFLRWVANDHAGYVTSCFMKFADWPTSLVYRTDTMDRDLPMMLAEIGVPKEKAKRAIAETEGKAKPRNSFAHPPEASNESIAVFEQSEATAYWRFGFAPIIF